MNQLITVVFLCLAVILQGSLGTRWSRNDHIFSQRRQPLYGISKLPCRFPDEYHCPRTEQHCISKHAKCNGVKDCPEGDDENNCMNCMMDSSDLKCAGQSITYCYQKHAICDGDRDCPHGDDEMQCPASDVFDRNSPYLHRRAESYVQLRNPEDARAIPRSWSLKRQRDQCFRKCLETNPDVEHNEQGGLYAAYRP